MNDGKRLARQLSIILISVSTIGFLASFTIYLGELLKNGVETICFSSECYRYFEKRFDSSIEILKGTVKLLVAIATIGGIYIAVKSYVNSSYASAISNHISNYRVFKEFIENEISNKERVSEKSVNTILWYNKLFPDSRTGALEVPKDYKSLIEKINQVIIESNHQYATSQKPDFSYTDHQDRMINTLHGLGIEIQRLPRNEFYQAEEQILDVISVVNIEFCTLSEKDYGFCKRNYI